MCGRWYTTTIQLVDGGFNVVLHAREGWFPRWLEEGPTEEVPLEAFGGDIFQIVREM